MLLLPQKIFPCLLTAVSESASSLTWPYFWSVHHPGHFAHTVPFHPRPSSKCGQPQCHHRGDLNKQGTGHSWVRTWCPTVMTVGGLSTPVFTLGFELMNAALSTAAKACPHA